MGQPSASRTVARVSTNWSERVAELEQLLERARAELIDAETQLAERISAINLFEFQMRAATRPLLTRLDELRTEIDNYQKKLHDLERGIHARSSEYDSEQMLNETEAYRVGAGATADEEFRYHRQREAEANQEAPNELSEDEAKKLKQLYRQLARRFHPDFAANEADRNFRTEIMMRINTAYTAQDIELLEKLRDTPDGAGEFITDSDQQKAQQLYTELAACQRRLDEVKTELKRLLQHKSTKLMQRAEKLGKQGRDMFTEIADDIRRKIASALAERDIIREEVDNFDPTDERISSDRVADAVYEMGLEEGLDDDEEEPIDDDWGPQWVERASWEDDGSDDV